MRAIPFNLLTFPTRIIRLWVALAGLLLLGLDVHAQNYTFNGRVTDGGVGVGGVRINYNWTGPFGQTGRGFVTTDVNGNWSSGGWGFGTGIAFSPAQAGYGFDPESRSVFTSGGSRSGLNFSRISHTISGNVSRGDVPMGGVTVTLAGPLNRSTTTAANGNYSFTMLRTGAYTVTPGSPGLTFSPASREISLGSNRTGQNFLLLPTVRTLAPGEVAFGEAVVNGTIAGGGLESTTAWFEYGTGGEFNFATPEQTAPAGTDAVSVTDTIQNLPAGIIYNHRLMAANSTTTNFGGTRLFLMPYPAAGNSVTLDGINSYVQVGSSALLRLTDAMTLEAWVNPIRPISAADTRDVIMGREGEYLIARGGNGAIYYAKATAAAFSWRNTGVILPNQQWSHLALTFDGTDVRVYVNGLEAFSETAAGTIGDANTVENDFRIGGRQAVNQFFLGQIDEVRVWGEARTPAEIDENFRRRLTGTEPGLLAYYQFDEETGGATADSGPHALDGTLVTAAGFEPSGAHIRDPIAATLAATPVLATRATLRATVNPSDSGTVAFFEYGETIAYGRTTESQDVGSGLQNVAVGAAITDLQPGTTYHYRSVAFNEFGTTYGEDRTFTTLVLGVGWPTSTKVTGGFADSPKHVVDSEGNAYVAGSFSGSATFKGTLNSQNDTPDAFVGKLGRGADWLFASQIIADADGMVDVRSVAVDQARNVYVAGRFSGTATLGTHVLTATGATDAFVAKLNSGGDTWLWARSVGADQDDSVNALAVTPGGSVFVAGHFQGDVDFETVVLASVSGGRDIFVARLDADGTWLWARGAGGSGSNDSASAIVLNNATDAFVTGTFQGVDAAFNGAIGGTTLAAAGGEDDTDLFVARINSEGEWLLARRAGGNGEDRGTALALDAAGNVYLLGQFAGSADYGGTVENLNSGSDTRLFVAKLNSNANMLWYAQAGAGFADSITVDPAGHVYVSGEFTISTAFGSPTAFSLISSGNSDVFLARLNAESGAWVWGEKIGSSGAEHRGSVGVDGRGGIVVSGTFQNTVPVGHVLLTTANERDIFIARLDADAVFEHNTYEIGRAIPVPLEAQDPDREDGGAIGQPSISILEREHADSDGLNAFVWSISERKLYPVRPVTAILKWPLTTDATNTTSVATAVGRSVWPAEPQIHVAGAPVELEPQVPGFPHRFLNLAFTTINGANVESGNKVFTADHSGWSVLQFLDTAGELPNPAVHPSRFEVVNTVLWNNPAHLLDNRPATIGDALGHPGHNDPTGKNGYVLFDRSFYDGAGNERAHDRATRTGPILPVNRDTSAADDDLVVAWYRTNQVTGVAWPSLPIRYVAQWPAAPDELVLAGGLGSGLLSPADFPGKRVYNQPDPTRPGFNPNEEHAALYGDVLHALRNDLNELIDVSEPFTLLKHRDPATGEWTMKVFKVVAANSTFPFAYDGEAGQQLSLPAPLSLLPLCRDSNTWISGPGFQDHLGRLHARAASPNGEDATIVARYWYPLQPGFYYDLDGDGEPDAPVGDCIAWLDRRPGGTPGVPVDITYNITWPEVVPTLQIGETLLGAKFGLPDLRNFAHAGVIFDAGDPDGGDGAASLVRMFDPLAPRTLQLRPEGADDFLTGPGYDVFRVDDAASLFTGLATANDAGLTVFTDLPFTLRSRLRYDSLNQNLIFSGLLDESQHYGGPDNPLLLLNVLGLRERERLKLLNLSPEFGELIDALYDLTRNPNRLDLDDDDQPDPDLLVGLIENDDGEVIPEVLGDGPKVLTAGMAASSGFITLVENNDASLGGLPVTLHVIRVDGGPVRGDIKVVQSDNVFDERLTLRHSADFGGEPQNFEFEWFYRSVGSDTNAASAFPTVDGAGDIDDLAGWTQFSATPPGPDGLNDITLGDGGTSSLLVLADNYFICRYRGYVIAGETNWSDWVGIIGGGRAQLAEGWVKRVRDGLNPFEARTREFHENETVTFASMLQQAGARYEGSIAFNPDGGNINSIGLIEAYETVLRRAKGLSIEAVPPINFQPANDALLLAAGFIADLYFLLGNEAVADAADPTIGFRTSSAGYGTLAPSIFAFQNQLDSLLEEELTLLRGRDDRSATVRLPPVYNRLFWNFTRDEGEVAYAQAYNITDQSGDGFIDATDARIMYPQAHGDAWGHYLTATKTYYGLLQNPRFDWIPRSEPILLAGVPVNVDYLDERKFARAAAAKAKVGAEVVDLTYRLGYVDDPEGQFQGYKDTDPERAWGLSDWGHRAGSAAFFDWVVANAVLPSVDPEPTHVGIEKIDRTTVPELTEIIAGYEAVQSQVDKADAGLNPLGVAKNSVPFDIDPSQVSAGKTHFEQIYDRAIEAVNNTVTVFNHANQLSQALRGLQDTVNDFSRNVDQQERDYKNRLIEVFGYPYAGDIGAGRTYPSGYDGPDIYHHMYIDTVPLNGEPAFAVNEEITAYYTPLLPQLGRGVATIRDFFFGNDTPENTLSNVTDGVLRVSYPLSSASYGLTAPPAWGERRAPGELQLALSDLLQSRARLKQAIANYDGLIAQIDDGIELMNARFNLQAETINIRNTADGKVKSLRAAALGFKVTGKVLQGMVDKVDSLTDITTESLPKVIGVSNDATAPARGVVKLAAKIGTTALKVGAGVAEGAAEAAQTAQDDARRSESIQIETATFDYETRQKLKELEQLIRQEPGLRLEAFALREALTQTVGRYRSTLARGLRLVEERVAFRKNAAADTQQSRYQDMTFRIFRNDAIQKYRAQFDLAAQYVYHAAVAYDFETQLLGGRPGAGRAFLTDIVKQRALGEVVNGVPVAGRHGLADPLARLSQNFGVLKGQLGFNNPQTETGRFSLRNEMLRLRDTSDEEWRAELKKSIVPDLWDVPEFRRHCRPFAPESAGPQPGLVLRFPTTVTFGLNYFGWPLGGGDSAYDPTLFATKVRSAGVWFSDYNGSGLSVTPRVYLVPVGADVMRSPSGNDLETREWRVVDQKIPVPFPIGFSSLNEPSWIPMNDSLSDTFADIRRFSSFRAFHDSGVFDPSETIADSRLIGRSVWNTDWMLIIPGGTFLFDADEGLETFIDSVSDIKIFFQTYAYSGN